MAIALDGYTASGRLRGSVVYDGRLRDLLERAEAINVEDSWRTGAAGSPEVVRNETIAIDDLLLVVPDAADATVHAAWHDVALDIGPYHLTGELPTLPGFDPGRALARPGGTFVLLRGVSVTAPDRSAASVTHPFLLVNRYAVDAVEADLMLGFFFPGATISVTVTEAPADMPAASPAPTSSAAPSAAPASAPEPAAPQS